jgi:hypothetical protein
LPPTEEFFDWAEINLTEGIRPYQDNREVAFWRLELQLKDIGRAFLKLDQFLGIP